MAQLVGQQRNQLKKMTVEQCLLYGQFKRFFLKNNLTICNFRTHRCKPPRSMISDCHSTQRQRLRPQKQLESQQMGEFTPEESEINVESD